MERMVMGATLSWLCWKTAMPISICSDTIWWFTGQLDAQRGHSRVKFAYNLKILKGFVGSASYLQLLLQLNNQSYHFLIWYSFQPEYSSLVPWVMGLWRYHCYKMKFISYKFSHTFIITNLLQFLHDRTVSSLLPPELLSPSTVVIHWFLLILLVLRYPWLSSSLCHL